jgi:hypothetical protein
MSPTHNRSLPAACAALGALLICLATSARSAMDNTSAPQARLQAWVGHWHTKGESGGTPWHADTQCAWSPNHEFVVCDQLINDRVDQLMILSYDPSAKAFRISSIGKDRAPLVAFGTVHGAVWTNDGEFEQDGKKVLIRTVVDFSVPRHYSDRETISADGGAHWTEESRGKAVQVQ